MGKTLRAGAAGASTVVFVETLLPPGIDAIRAEGIEYVATIEPVEDLPVWADAVRLRDRVFTRKPSA